MILLPYAKINLGLNVIIRRKDSFHNIETVFYPVGLSDILEFIISPDGKMKFNNTGFETGNDLNNICIKAYHLLKNKFDIPPLHIHLHKIIPVGAGLGGGSSDAAFMLKGLNSFFNLGLSDKDLVNYAAVLGSDCPFFIHDNPLFAEEKGDKFTLVNLSLQGMHIVIVYPYIKISTSEAYKLIVPKIPDISIKEIIKKPLQLWKDELKNDFEDVVFNKYHEIKILKEKMYQKGAVYASMSGSGSAVYGLFEKKPDIRDFNNRFFIWKGIL